MEISLNVLLPAKYCFLWNKVLLKRRPKLRAYFRSSLCLICCWAIWSNFSCKIVLLHAYAIPDPKLVCLQCFEYASLWILLVVSGRGFIYVAKGVKRKLWPCLSSLLLPFVLGTLVWCVWAACWYVACPPGTVGLLPSMERLQKEMHELNMGSHTALSLLVEMFGWKMSKISVSSNKKSWPKHKNYTYF